MAKKTPPSEPGRIPTREVDPDTGFPEGQNPTEELLKTGSLRPEEVELQEAQLEAGGTKVFKDVRRTKPAAESTAEVQADLRKEEGS